MVQTVQDMTVDDRNTSNERHTLTSLLCSSQIIQVYYCLNKKIVNDTEVYRFISVSLTTFKQRKYNYSLATAPQPSAETLVHLADIQDPTSDAVQLPTPDQLHN